jgi:biotin operon repressor
MFDEIEKLERLDQLIRLNATGTPNELAKKLNISRSSVFRLINEMRELGCPIAYYKLLRTYAYEKSGKLVIKFLDQGMVNKTL